MGNHSIIAPSSAPVWGSPEGCTGSVLMAHAYPDTEENEAAIEGDATHEFGAWLVGAMAVGNFPIIKEGGWQPSNGLYLTNEMIEAVQMYADDVNFVMIKSGNFNPHIEERIAIPQIHKLSWGTPDLWFFDRVTGRLYIWDFKFGFRVIEAFENWQMLNYLAGIIAVLDVPDDFIEVHIRVVQPRAFHREGSIREWVVNAVDLRGYFNQLESKAHEALKPGAPFTTGNHCRDCSGRHACPAALKAGVQLYEVAAQPIPFELPVDALSVQLSIVRRALEQLKCIDTGLTAQIDGLIRKGIHVQGWGLESKRGRQTWSTPINEVLLMGDCLDVNLRKDNAITPKQAITAGITKNVVDAYSSTKSTGLKLAPDDGKKAERLFK